MAPRAATPAPLQRELHFYNGLHPSHLLHGGTAAHRGSAAPSLHTPLRQDLWARHTPTPNDQHPARVRTEFLPGLARSAVPVLPAGRRISRQSSPSQSPGPPPPKGSAPPLPEACLRNALTLTARPHGSPGALLAGGPAALIHANRGRRLRPLCAELLHRTRCPRHEFLIRDHLSGAAVAGGRGGGTTTGLLRAR